MIEYRQLKTITGPEKAQLLALYSDAEWVDSEDCGDFLYGAVAGSAVFLAAADTESGRIIGCARALSDGVSDAYIQDVVVDPAYRKRHVGSELVLRVRDCLRAQGIDWIGLVGAPGTENFYRKLGLTELPGHTLWKL